MNAVECVVDLEQGKLTKIMTSGPDPEQFALTLDEKKMYIANEDAGKASVLDVAAGKIVGEIEVGARAARVRDRYQDAPGHRRGEGGHAGVGDALSPDEKFLFVANGPSNDVSVVEVAAMQEVQRIQCGESPWGVAVVEIQNPKPE